MLPKDLPLISLSVFIFGRPVVDLIKTISTDSVEVIIYDLIKECETRECFSKVAEYGIKSIPSVVVDGQLLDCCSNSGVSQEQLIKAGIIKN